MRKGALAELDAKSWYVARSRSMRMIVGEDAVCWHSLVCLNGCRSTRTLTKSYHANSYPSQLVPNTNSYSGQSYLLPTRTQTISYPIPTRTQADYIELLLLCNVSYEQEHNTLFPLPCLPLPLPSPPFLYPFPLRVGPLKSS